MANEQKPNSPKWRARQISLLVATLLVASVWIFRHPLDKNLQWLHSGGTVHPWIHSPEEAARQLQEEPPESLFAALFAYGEFSGWALPLSEGLDRAVVLDPQMVATYLDGLAHGLQLTPDEIDGAAAQINARLSGAQRVVLHDGVVRSLVEHQASDLPKAHQLAEAYGEAAGALNITNGFRVGVQRALGDDIENALDAAGALPAILQPAVFEELGWRVGDRMEPFSWLGFWEPKIAEERLPALISRVPDAWRCVFLHGVARGRTMVIPLQDADTSEALSHLVDLVGSECRDARVRGIAWAFHLRLGVHPESISVAIDHIGDASVRGQVQSHLARLQTQQVVKKEFMWSPVRTQ